MYASRTTQLIVGVFAILGVIALGILSLSLGRIPLFPPPGYTLYASFDNISGLKTGDEVQLAGVQVGKVTQIEIKDNEARIGMRINDGVEIDKDAIVACKTSGIIGEKYVSLQLGPSDHFLKDGDTVHQTQSCFVLEDAIGQLINNPSSGGGQSGGSEKSTKPATPDKESKPANPPAGNDSKK